MKAKLLSFCLLLLCVGRVFADGQIVLKNVGIYSSEADKVYRVPIWVDLNADGVTDPGEGLGNYADALGQTATLALYLQDDPTPLATALFRKDTYGQFLGTPPSQDVFIPGFVGGQRAPLTIKVWIGPSYETSPVRGSWNFLSLPLGGQSPNGPPVPPPSVEGWGDPNGSGFALTPPVRPVTAPDAVTRRSFSDARISIADLLANDSDPAGGSIVFARVDTTSAHGATISVVDSDVVYRGGNVSGNDSFSYYIRNTAGGVAYGRVNVVTDDPEGMIFFRNHNIQIPGMALATYNVPLYVDANFDAVANPGEALGAFAATYYNQPANLALYLKGTDIPLASATFNSTGAAPFIDPASQTVIIPNAPPGARVELTIKAWIGSSYDTAQVKQAWNILSLPLGGGLATGENFAIPGLYGWGDPTTGEGFALRPGPKPIATTDEISRPYRQNTTVTIETLLSNDTDPDGGTLTFVSVDAVSNGGASISKSGSTITYTRNAEADDYFFYTIRSSHGVTGKGRVNVKMGEPIGEIFFSNYNIPKASGPGIYNVPIFIDYNTNGVFDTGEDLASFAAMFGKTATLGLYQQGSNQPITTMLLSKTDSGAGASGTLPPGTLSTMIFTTGRGVIDPGTVIAMTFAGNTFSAIRNDGQLMGSGTFAYTPVGNNARLLMNYAGSTDYDDFMLTFNPGGVGTYTGTQTAGPMLMNADGTFVYSGIGILAPTTAFPGSSVLVPTSRPGDEAPLTVKVWVGENFESATVKQSWDFTSLPLGGPRADGSMVPIPGLTGWGDESGKGYALDAGPTPIAGSDLIRIPETHWIPIGMLLPNDSDPAGGPITFFNVDAVSQKGIPITVSNSAIYLQNAPVGVDTFEYRIVSASGAVGSGFVQVTFDPCTDCNTDPGNTTTTGGTTTGGGPPAATAAVVNVSNRLVHRSDRPGAYNIPIWIDANFNGRRDAGEGIGTFANQLGQTAAFGVYLRNGTNPIATARFFSDSRGAFLGDPEFQTIHIPGKTPGSVAELTLKAWIGPDFESAPLKASWDYNSLPLGWGADIIGIPDLSGWGDELTGRGYGIVPGVKPKTYGAVITRAPGQNVNIKIADMTKNDSDPEGGPLTFVSVDETSHEGGVVTVLGNTVYYIAPINDTDAPDYFEYTVRNEKGGIAKGRVDVVVTDTQGQFNTLLIVENLSDGNHISFRGVLGSNYLVQFREGIDGAWQDLGPATHEAFGLFTITDTTTALPVAGVHLLSPPAPIRFYRVLTQKP